MTPWHRYQLKSLIKAIPVLAGMATFAYCWKSMNAPSASADGVGPGKPTRVEYVLVGGPTNSDGSIGASVTIQNETEGSDQFVVSLRQTHGVSTPWAEDFRRAERATTVLVFVRAESEKRVVESPD
jgi:hypothetical protein